MTRLVLASASPGRRKVLRQAGIDPLVIVSGVDEDAIVASLGPTATPDEVTTALAAAKAGRVAANLDPVTGADCVVVGCDSMLYVDGSLCGKPESAEAARRQWLAMAGGPGQLHTGHCVIRLRDSQLVSQDFESTSTTVYFGVPSATELDAYIAGGEPLSVAGGFTLDGLSGWFIEKVDGDPSNVIGISLPLTRSLLARAGLSVPTLWKSNPVA
jgi:septum formation protein